MAVMDVGLPRNFDRWVWIGRKSSEPLQSSGLSGIPVGLRIEYANRGAYSFHFHFLCCLWKNPRGGGDVGVHQEEG